REGDGVALVQQRLAQVVDDVLGADAGGDVGAGVAGQADFRDVLEEGVEQRVAAAVAAVLAGVAFERLAGGGVDVVAGQEIGDADGEADDVAAFGLQALGLLGDLHDRAGLGAAEAAGELGHADLAESALATVNFTTYGARIRFHSATRSAFAASTASASPSMVTLRMWSPCSTLSTASMPSTTLPNTVCLPSSQGVATWVMKNWPPLVFGPALPMDSTPRSWASPLPVSSSNR